MESYLRAAVERAMKIQEVILRAVAKKITWGQAAETSRKAMNKRGARSPCRLARHPVRRGSIIEFPRASSSADWSRTLRAFPRFARLERGYALW